MKQVSGKAFCRVVERAGWQRIRITGSHHIYGKPNEQTKLSIPVHGNRPLKTGLLRRLMKLGGINENDL